MMPPAIEPTPEGILSFVAEDPDAPVAMLNLVRFVPGDGAARHAEYGRRVLPHLTRVGAKVIYAGLGGSALAGREDEAWDQVYLVHYPTRRAFAEMVLDDAYLELTQLRASSLDAAVLLPTAPLAGAPR